MPKIYCLKFASEIGGWTDVSFKNSREDVLVTSCSDLGVVSKSNPASEEILEQCTMAFYHTSLSRGPVESSALLIKPIRVW